MKRTYAILLLLVLQGCATFKESVDVAQIKDGETVLIGKLTLERKRYLSGELVSHEVVPFTSVSLALKPFNSVSEIPNLYLGYSGVTRILVNESANILVPVEPTKYYLVDIFAKPRKILGEYIQQEFSKQRGMNGTLEIVVKKGVGNYIGHIHVLEIQERYKDLNGDRNIDRSEFKSSFVSFDEAAKGKTIIPETAYWRSISLQVIDDSGEVKYPHQLEKSLAKVVKF